jgi:ABC-type transport system substrate-binding protein
LGNWLGNQLGNRRICHDLADQGREIVVMSRKYALIIGNTEYTDPGLAQLTAPGRDAEDFARVLDDREIGAFDEVSILLNEPEYVVREAIDDFFNNKKPDDLLVLYFSGHGVRDELGALYLAVKNTIRTKLRATGIKSDYIREVMDQSRSKRQVLILDCCNSGAFSQGTKAATGVSIGIATAFEAGYGRIILTASDSTQFAWEGDKVIGETDNSLFTHFLVEGLKGEADRDSDGRITVDELYDYAYERVKLATPKQTPSKFSSKQQGEIVLRQIMRMEDIKPVALPEDLISEMENRYPEVRLGAVGQLVKLLNGKNLGLARSAREALERIEKEDDSRRVSQAASQALEQAREAERIAAQKAEEACLAREQAERLAAQKAEEERIAREKAEEERKAREELERRVREKVEAEWKAKEEAERLAAQKAEEERSAREEAKRLAILKAEEERLAREKAESERKAKEEAERLMQAQVERVATEREAARIKAEREAAKLAARKASEKAEWEQSEREAMELAARKKAERGTKDRVEGASTKVAGAQAILQQQPFLKWVVVGIIGCCAIALASWSAYSYFAGLPSPAPIEPVPNETPAEKPPAHAEEVFQPPQVLPPPVVTDPDLVTPEPSTPLSSWTSFNVPHPILGDWRVRRAMAYCTNRIELIKSVYPLLSTEEQQGLIAYSFIPRSHWAYPGDENLFIYPFNPAKGRTLLEEAGWVLSGGSPYRAKDGNELAVGFTTTNAAFRQTWAAVWEQQMANCGIRITRNHAPASWWFGDTTGLARRDFELGAFAWVGQADPGGGILYACDQIPFPNNGWEGQNYMGWCNEEASRNIKIANNTLARGERIAAYRAVQQEFTRDVPSIPLFNRTGTFAISANLADFNPVPGQEFYNYNVHHWKKTGSDTVVLGFTQEPASLFTLVENAFVANIAYQLLRPAQYTSLNYDFQAVLVKQLPTIENGGTAINEVEVKQGDKIVDVNGDVVQLKSGVRIKNAAGEEVEYKNGTVKMTQLVSRFELIDGLTWEDGTPVSKADLQLGHRISCDPNSGATSYSVCDRTAKVGFFDTGYIQTWLPGALDPLYFIPVWPIYPNHQLGTLPAVRWATDPRVAEKPLSYGPYKLVDWIKGDRLIFAANEHWVGDGPRSPNLVIQIISPESTESLLLSGEIDILGSDSLFGITETLDRAEKTGKIKTIVIPSATWEHIDFNLFVNP